MEIQKHTPSKLSAKKGRSAFWIIATIVLLIGVIGGGVWYYIESTRMSSEIQSLTDQKKVAENELAASTAQEVVQYREIPELGVKYRLTESVKDLTYAFGSNEDGMARTANFSTIVMTAMKEAGDVHGSFPCTSAAAPSGHITRYNDGEQHIMETKVKDIGKKIGDFYVVYDHPQFACSVNGQTVEGLQESIDAVRSVYDSLEAM